MHRFALLLSLLLLLAPTKGQTENPNSGTLIVTYQTDPNGQQLDHIRFWISNAKNERVLYPKKDGFVTNPNMRHQRTVVIAHLPPGLYTIEFLVPNRNKNFEKIPPRTVEIAPGTVAKVNQEIKTMTSPAPNMVAKGSLNVITDLPQATFILKTVQGEPVGQSQGSNYTFQDLPEGNYEITFSSTDPKLYIAPPAQKVYVPLNQSEHIKVAYLRRGSLNLNGNLDHFHVKIKSLNSDETVQADISHLNRQIYLPEGKYMIASDTVTPDGRILRPVEVEVRTTSPQNVFLAFEKAPEASPTKGSNDSITTKSGIKIESNIPDFHLTFQNLNREGQVKLFTAKNKTLFIPLTEDGNYTLTFAMLPLYVVPKPITIEYKKDDLVTIDMTYELGESLLEVPEGVAIIGDSFHDDTNNENSRPAEKIFIPAFEIAAYPVTNSQYAQWLSDAYRRGLVKLDKEHEGHVLDTKGTLLCRTKEANPLAQISVRKKSGNGPKFTPIAGKELYPVIEVTWYGADSYCRNQGLRLPSEKQWEKAAGMSIGSEGHPAVRYRYGFGSNAIDRTWANYRYSVLPRNRLQVLTSPIGFYNGRNSLPLSPKDRSQTFTKNAQSPIGAYDMSGNVWEWTDSWDELPPSETRKIAKGGCYDSFEEGVRVSERLSITPNYADIYTGFRTAKY